MASRNIFPGDKGEPADDPNEKLYDVPDNNRRVNDDPEANDDQKVILAKDVSHEVTNSTRDSGKPAAEFPKHEKCLKKQGYVCSTDNDDPEYVSMHDKETVDGSVVPYMTVTLSGKLSKENTIHRDDDSADDNDDSGDDNDDDFS